MSRKLIQTFMAIQVFLKPSFQYREKFFALFGDNSIILLVRLFILLFHWFILKLNLPFRLSQRDKIIQPRVARNELP